jgi:hypothetical protein
MKREEEIVLSSLLFDLIHAENSTSKFKGVLRQAEFIPKLLHILRESPEEVLADFESIRKQGMADNCFFYYDLN